jgi:hypothetical protein
VRGVTGQNYDLELVKWLVETARVDLNVVGAGKSALGWAEHCGRREAADYLRSKGAVEIPAVKKEAFEAKKVALEIKAKL